MELRELIQTAWTNRELLKEDLYADAVRALIEEVDKGRLRTAAPTENGWQVNEWVKQGILMYFAIQQMQTFTLPPFGKMNWLLSTLRSKSTSKTLRHASPSCSLPSKSHLGWYFKVNTSSRRL